MLLWFRKPPQAEREMAEKLYNDVVLQSRQAFFYADMGVPDTVDGRFDMVLLHSFILLQRLRVAAVETRALSQTFYDVMFVDMDRAVREMGIGDLSVKKHIRRMMRAFNGRMAAYDAAGSAEDMKGALSRNVYGTLKTPVDPAALEAMIAYVQQAQALFNAAPLEILTVAGQLPWPVAEQKKAA